MTAQRDEYLFVYGTLREAVKHDLRNVALKGCNYYSHGWTHGELYDFGEYPGLFEGDAMIQGEVYQLENPASVLHILDYYEGATADDIHGQEFERKLVEVHINEEKAVQAWVYFCARDKKEGEAILENDYITYRKSRQQEQQ